MAAIAAFAAGGSEAYRAHQAKKYKTREAKAYREAKNRSMAATTREMSEEERNKELMHSRAVALAAASGGGVDDPGIDKLLGDLNAEGEYRVMSKLWTGQNDAEGLIFRAEAAQREADDSYTAGIITALSSATAAYHSAGGSRGSFGGATTVPRPKKDFSGREIVYE
jgi:hypothetical protein